MHIPPLSVWPQYAMPRLALTRAAGRLARAQGGAWTHWAIERFIARYGVDMSEAQDSDPRAYASFNDFFTRALRADARPLATSAFISPVDGAISQLGPLTGAAHDRLIQAKGHDYSVLALLGGDAQAAQHYAGGHFATLYLSPRDYHRIHMPCAGRLRRMTHVPGDLFSVNPTTAAAVPGLFARNERVVCEFDGDFGPMALVLVGATIVGSMATVWHDVVNPPRPGQLRSWRYAPGDVSLDRGQEMGRFLLGSTVVMLWPRGVMQFTGDFAQADAAGRAIRMGQAMGECMGLYPNPV